jgi:hypothetical protein
MVVLGMHRSGTSAMAGTLKLLGVDLGSDLIPAAEKNPKGYFENNKVNNLNELILKTLGSKWDDLFPLPYEWWAKKEIRDLHEKAGRIIADDLKSAGIIGIKDPRFCILLPFWLEVFRELDIEPYFIIMVRDPLEVAGSLEKKGNFDNYGFSEEKSLLLWVKHNLDSELFSRGRPRIFIDFNEFIASPVMVIEKAFGSLRLQPPKNIRAHEKELLEFIDPQLRHFEEKPMRNGRRAAKPVAELYSLLLKNTRARTKASDFDRIRLRSHGTPSLTAVREYLDRILIIIKNSFLFNKNRIPGFPEESGFRGYLDSPEDNVCCAKCCGWFVSKKPFKKVELFIGDKKIADLERTVAREDVKREIRGYDHTDKQGFEYVIPDAVLSELKNKTRTLFIRFHINGERYVDKFHTAVRL